MAIERKRVGSWELMKTFRTTLGFLKANSLGQYDSLWTICRSNFNIQASPAHHFISALPVHQPWTLTDPEDD